MAITLFAAVSVGSYELEMKIFEISLKNGINEIDRISHIIELGRETYNFEKISSKLVDELCDVLYDYSEIMKSYDIKDYRVCATSAIREAVNAQNIIDRIKVRTGLDVDILSNSEQRYISYKAFAINEKNFDKIIENGTLLIDMGAGSAQVTLFDKGSLITTQNIRLGALRIREMLAIIEEYIDNDIQTLYKIFMKDRNIINIIGTGENSTYICLTQKAAENGLKKKECITKEEFYNLYAMILNNTEEQLADILNVPQVQASLIIPSVMLFRRIFHFTHAVNLWMPNVKLGDGLAVEYAQKNKLIKPNHDFMEDILSAAREISIRYQCNVEHTLFVEENVLKIFDAMKKYHGLNKRERLIIQIASILHDCGKYVSLINPAEAAYDIIMSTEIIGLSHAERDIVAHIVKYNTMDFDYRSDITDGKYQNMYITVTKLMSILRVANALDRSHKQKMKNTKMYVEEKQLIISTNTYEDITLEKGLLDEKATFFEEVYGISIVIKQRKK